MRSNPPVRSEPDEPIPQWHRALHQDYRQLLEEVARLDAQWLLDDRIRFAWRNERPA